MHALTCVCVCVCVGVDVATQGIYPKVLRAKPSALRDARTLRMWTAAGPFTLASDIAYTVRTAPLLLWLHAR